MITESECYEMLTEDIFNYPEVKNIISPNNKVNTYILTVGSYMGLGRERFNFWARIKHLQLSV